MLTNEQRAHDLAIAMLPVLQNICVQSAISNNEENATFDAYNEYKNVYFKVLDSFKRDFPAE